MNSFLLNLNVLLLAFFASGLAAAVAFWEVAAYALGAGPLGLLVSFVIGVPYFGPAALVSAFAVKYFLQPSNIKNVILLFVLLLVLAAALLSIWMYLYNNSAKLETDFGIRFLVGHVALGFLVLAAKRFGYPGLSR